MPGETATEAEDLALHEGVAAEDLAVPDLRQTTSASGTGPSGFTTSQTTWKWLSITHQASSRTPENAAEPPRKGRTLQNPLFFKHLAGCVPADS